MQYVIKGVERNLLLGNKLLAFVYLEQVVQNSYVSTNVSVVMGCDIYMYIYIYIMCAGRCTLEGSCILPVLWNGRGNLIV
jgi:hypothetical protein